MLNRSLIIALSFVIMTFSVYAIDPNNPDSIIFGNLDGSHIEASPGETINIPVWVKNDEDVSVLQIPLATENQYVAEMQGGILYDFMSFWDLAEFYNPEPGEPDSGYTSQMMVGINEMSAPWHDSVFNTQRTWLKIAEFTVVVSSDPANIGQVSQLYEGYNTRCGGTLFGSPPDISWVPIVVGGTISIVQPPYEYLPGDANMYVGLWPPAVLNSDVTYLSGYFRGNPANPPCNLDGFWASADANGDCSVLGSDVTRLINYFRGLAEIEYCPDYEPFDLPPIMPSGWPNCEPVILNVKVIPAEIKGLE